MLDDAAPLMTPWECIFSWLLQGSTYCGEERDGNEYDVNIFSCTDPNLIAAGYPRESGGTIQTALSQSEHGTLCVKKSPLGVFLLRPLLSTWLLLLQISHITMHLPLASGTQRSSSPSNAERAPTVASVTVAGEEVQQFS